MRYIATSVSLYACLWIVSFTSFTLQPFVFTILLLLILANESLRTLVIIKRNIPGQVQIRSQKKSINGIIILSVALALLFFIIEGRTQIYFTAVWCSLLISGILEDYLYRKHKPVTLVIDQNELIFSGISIARRNLEVLTGIRLNGFTNHLVCSFSESSSIAISFSDYTKEDMELFIETAKSRSRYPVELSTNLVVDHH